jgi:hypothetical protein
LLVASRFDSTKCDRNPSSTRRRKTEKEQKGKRGHSPGSLGRTGTFGVTLAAELPALEERRMRRGEADIEKTLPLADWTRMAPSPTLGTPLKSTQTREQPHSGVFLLVS